LAIDHQAVVAEDRPPLRELLWAMASLMRGSRSEAGSQRPFANAAAERIENRIKEMRKQQQPLG